MSSEKNIHSVEFKTFKTIFISLALLINITSAQDIWQQTNGPSGGFVTSFAANTDGDIFASTLYGSIFKSNDNGNSWNKLEADILPYSTQVIKMNDNNELFAGTALGIYRSFDSGTSWDDLTDQVEYSSILTIAFNPDGHIFVGTHGNGIYRSVNNGDTWEPVNNGLSFGANDRVEGLVIDKTSGDMYTAITGSGIFQSTNNGDSWNLVNSTLNNQYFRDLLITPGKELLLVASFDGVYRSTDGGATWDTVNRGINNLYTWTIAQSSSGELFLGASGGDIFYSNDLGENWQSIDNDFTNNSITSIFSFGSNFLFVGTHGQGIFLSLNNGSSWNEKNSGFINSNIPDLVIIEYNEEDDEVFAATSGDGAFRSTNSGESWERINEGLIADNIEQFAITTDNKIYVATAHDGVFRSFDKGNSWTQINSGLPSTSVYSIEIDPSNGIIYTGLTSQNGVFRSTNGGDSWVAANNGMNLKSGARVEDLAIAPNGNIYAATAYWETSAGMLRSTNGGSTWEQINNGLTELYVTSVAAFDDNLIFAGTLKGIFRSLDGGNSWEEVKWTNNQVYSIKFNSLGHIFAASYGIKRSLDFGATWHDYNTGLTDLGTRSIAVDANNYLFTGTWTSGVLKTISSTTLKQPLLNNPEDGEAAVPVNVTLSWQPLLSATAYDLQVSTNSNFDPIGNEEFGIRETTKTVDGLKYNTTYFWRVRASNAHSMSDWSEPYAFTTLKAGPNLTNPGNGQRKLGLSIEFTWSSIDGSDLYEFDLALDSLFQNPVQDYTTPNTNYVYEELDYSNKYYWRVRARVQGEGYTDWSDTWNFSTLLAPPQLNNPSNYSVELPILVDFEWLTIPTATEYWLQVGESSIFDANIIDITGIPTNKVTSDIFDFNKVYYWRVAGFADGNWGEWSQTYQFTTMIYPANVDINKSYSFPTYSNPDDYKGTDYRLIGLPGNADLAVDQVLGEGSGEKWIAYWDNGEQQDYLEKFSADNNAFRFLAGRAFWVLNKGPLNIDMSVLSVQLNFERHALLNIHNGWNIITNPFPDPVPWAMVQELNGLGTEPLWAFNGRFSMVSELQPYQGYYFDNFANQQTLNIPYNATLSKPLNQNQLEWQIKIILTSGKFSDASTWLGISEHSEDGIDQFDHRKPRAIGSVPMVYFNRSYWDENYSSLASDMRPGIDKKQIWDFEVKCNIDQESRLSFKGIEEVPENYEVYLVDRNKLATQNLREKNFYNFTPVAEHLKFSIIIGEQNSIAEELRTILPIQFKLGQNFPNPFNPGTVIPLELPEPNHIKLQIYDTLGKEIRTLYDGPVESGKHLYKWDGTNYLGNKCTSGLYIYKLETTTGFHNSQKMLLLR